MRRVALAVCAAALSCAAQAQTPPVPHFVPVPDNAILSSNVIGLGVYNGGREKVGEIKDVVIESGRLGGYIMSVGGFLGLGTHYVVINPGGISISYDASSKHWNAKIDATKDQLKAAPEFKYEDRWAK